MSAGQDDLMILKLKRNIALESDHDQKITCEIVPIPVFAQPDFLFHAEWKQRQLNINWHPPSFSTLKIILGIIRPGILMFRLPKRITAFFLLS